MTRMLIVDDDPRQLRLLSRIFSAADASLLLSTSSSGIDAIEQLQAESYDLVLTDIQMAKMDGLELVAWLMSRQPHVTVFTMTAYPDAEAMLRLRELGCIECFTKPVDVPRVLAKVSDALAVGVRGHIRNFSLASFLQLVEMEQKTCTLRVTSRGREGHLYFQNGRLVEARTGESRGDGAAIQIVSWDSPAITILSTCEVEQHTVESPAHFILMEAMRLQDEASQETMLAHPPDASAVHRGISEFPLPAVADAELLALVHLETGETRTLTGRRPEVVPMAQLGARLFEAKSAVGIDPTDAVEELVLTTRHHGVLVRPLRYDPERVAVLVFDPSRGNLAMERVELDGLVRDLEGWASGTG